MRLITTMTCARSKDMIPSMLGALKVDAPRRKGLRTTDFQDASPRPTRRRYLANSSASRKPAHPEHSRPEQHSDACARSKDMIPSMLGALKVDAPRVIVVISRIHQLRFLRTSNAAKA
jgi:hypothetical protein